MKYYTILLALFLFASCSNKSYFERKASEKIHSFYGGDLKSSAGFESKNGKTINHIILNIENSPLINNEIEFINYHAGNIAYLVYTNLDGYKTTYDIIKVNIKLNSNESRNFQFDTKELDNVHEISKILDKFNSAVIRKEYASIAQWTDNTLLNEDFNIGEIFEKINTDFGNIKQIQFQGFQKNIDPKIGEFYEFKQVIQLDNNNVTMLISIAKKNSLIVGFHI